jgi:hypothetical protein
MIRVTAVDEDELEMVIAKFKDDTYEKIYPSFFAYGVFLLIEYIDNAKKEKK